MITQLADGKTAAIISDKIWHAQYMSRPAVQSSSIIVWTLLLSDCLVWWLNEQDINTDDANDSRGKKIMNQIQDMSAFAST